MRHGKGGQINLFTDKIVSVFQVFQLFHFQKVEH